MNVFLGKQLLHCPVNAGFPGKRTAAGHSTHNENRQPLLCIPSQASDAVEGNGLLIEQQNTAIARTVGQQHAVFYLQLRLHQAGTEIVRTVAMGFQRVLHGIVRGKVVLVIAVMVDGKIYFRGAILQKCLLPRDCVIGGTTVLPAWNPAAQFLAKQRRHGAVAGPLLPGILQVGPVCIAVPDGIVDAGDKTTIGMEQQLPPGLPVACPQYRRKLCGINRLILHMNGSSLIPIAVDAVGKAQTLGFRAMNRRGYLRHFTVDAIAGLGAQAKPVGFTPAGKCGKVVFPQQLRKNLVIIPLQGCILRGIGKQAGQLRQQIIASAPPKFRQHAMAPKPFCAKLQRVQEQISGVIPYELL